ncbi:uncharacterized protein LOC143177947 isoform X2 [Calliopsis andreniformis]|uniref:uncharacterized protein LOC143177947 isoform X2 n=1 Tax=Calliopsis andreniformis TaxID=337506 RepID=UPI003FCC8604
MPMCIVKGCTNRSFMKSLRQEQLEERSKITFHMVPKDSVRRQLWLKNIGVDESSLPKKAVVCSCHFRNRDFDTTSLSYIRLKADAVPYLELPVDVKEKSSDGYAQILSEEGLSSCLRLALTEGSNTSDRSAESLNSSVKSIKHFREAVSCDEHIERMSRRETPSRSESISDKSIQVQMSHVDKSTSVSPERLWHSPRAERLREYIQIQKRQYQAQLRLLRQKCNRKTKRIEDLQATLKLFQNKNLSQTE